MPWNSGRSKKKVYFTCRDGWDGFILQNIVVPLIALYTLFHVRVGVATVNRMITLQMLLGRGEHRCRYALRIVKRLAGRACRKIRWTMLAGYHTMFFLPHLIMAIHDFRLHLFSFLFPIYSVVILIVLPFSTCLSERL